MAELEFVHVQLDELWTNVKDGSQDMWLWTAVEAITLGLKVCRVPGG